MRVITAVENYTNGNPFREIKCFLGGGITNCPDWQSEVIRRLETYPSLDNLVVFNPRRPDFPIGDPNASYEQIAWEYKWLNQCDIFSMFFCDGPSDQPICLYELGRNLLLKQICCHSDQLNSVVISCHNDYKRKQDVEIQVALADRDAKCSLFKSRDNSGVLFASTYGLLYDEHARRIAVAYHNLIVDLESSRIHGGED